MGRRCQGRPRRCLGRIELANGVETAHGILIRRTLLTDTSLIVHWLTREQGIVRTAARGARRPGSVFGGKLDLFYSADIAFVRGRRGDLHALREVGVTAYRQGIQASYARVLCAAYFASLIDLVVEKDAPVGAFHDLLRRGLDWLEGHEPTAAAVRFYEKEVAVELGIHGETGVAAADAILEMFHRLPESRGALMRRLEK